MNYFFPVYFDTAPGAVQGEAVQVHRAAEPARRAGRHLAVQLRSVAAAAQGKCPNFSVSVSFERHLMTIYSQSIDEFTKSHVQTLASMEKLLALLREHKSLRPAEADVELKKCAQMHAGVQNDIESAIDMGESSSWLESFVF